MLGLMYVEAREVYGSSFELGTLVMHQGHEMVVAREKDSEGDIQLGTMEGVRVIAHGLNGSRSLAHLDLSANGLAATLASALLEAVSGPRRSSFELKV